MCLCDFLDPVNTKKPPETSVIKLLDSLLLVLVEIPSLRCVEEDLQDVNVEQVKFEPERESARSSCFIKPVEGAVSLTNSGNDFFGCGSCIFDGAAKVFEVDYLFYIVVAVFDFHR